MPTTSCRCSFATRSSSSIRLEAISFYIFSHHPLAPYITLVSCITPWTCPPLLSQIVILNVSGLRYGEVQHLTWLSLAFAIGVGGFGYLIMSKVYR